MMTSVTLPSSSGPMHGGFNTSETDNGNDEPVFDPSAIRPAKRCLSPSGDAITPTDSSKKRRKQAMPVRISAIDSPPEGRPSPAFVPSPEPPASCCPVCQLSFSTPEQLQSHIASEHVPGFTCKLEPPSFSPPPSPQPPPPSESPPKWPHIPNTSKDPQWINPNILGFPAAFMGLPPFATQPDALPPRQPIRIFNPDAYCELCNKEFCNKYFLKTHKANKHGIYTDPPPDNPTSSASMQPVNIPSFSGSQRPATSLNLAVKMESKAFDILTNPFNKFFKPTPGSSSSSAGGGVISGNKPFEFGTNLEQPEAFLNGLDNNPEEPQENSSSPRTNNQTETTSQLNLKSEFDRTPNPEQLFYPTSPSKMSPPSGQQPQMQQQPQQQLQQLPLSQPQAMQHQPPPLRETFQEMSNRLRRIGVMNPKAFCEICCKEYCNKYFLRTHKMKRHGIFIPDDKNDSNIKSESHMPYPQTSPLNLIMSEQSSNSSDRKSFSPLDISCDICGIKFQNASLFQLHNISVHAKQPTPTEIPPPQETITSSDITERKAEPEKSNSADSISEDLQKLQTMILQLNDLDVSKVGCTCGTCGKDFENRYYLHAHMMNEHGILLDETPDAGKTPEPIQSTDANISNLNNLNNNTMCDLCGKDFPNSEDMKKHIIEAHQTQASISNIKQEFNNGFNTPDKTPRTSSSGPGNGPFPGKPSMNMTPTSSYCEICNKELCNKYFMKTHMQRMHGIEIENGAQIGGVICDICNKELCSKYFLRVHKHNTHGIVEYGSNMLPIRKFEDGANTPTSSNSNMLLPPKLEPQDSSLKPGDLADMSHRYFNHFTEVCPICARRFRSTKWLKAHMLSDHGPQGTEKWAELEQQLQVSIGQQKSSRAVTPSSKTQDSSSPTIKIPTSAAEALQQQQKLGLQTVLSSLFGADNSPKTYQCTYCPFSTSVLPFLFVHERSHVLPPNQQSQEPSQEVPDIPTPLKCPVCMQTFLQPDQLQHHVFTQHPFPPIPPFFNGFNGGNSEIPSQTEESTSKEPSEDETEDHLIEQQPVNKSPARTSKKVVRRKPPPGAEDALRDAANKSQLPATYALPLPGAGSNADDSPSANPYIMQAFLVEEQPSSGAGTSSPSSNPDAKIAPAIVFLPVLQKLSTPVTATFTLTPA